MKSPRTSRQRSATPRTRAPRRPAWPAVTTSTAPFVVVMVLAVIVAAMLLRPTPYLDTAQTICAGARCETVLLAAFGWLLVAGPMIAMALWYAFGPPTQLGLAGLVGLLVAFCFGVATVMVGGETRDVSQLDNLGSLRIGGYVAVAVTVVGALIGRAVGPAIDARRAARQEADRLRPAGKGGGRSLPPMAAALLVVAGWEVAGLAVVIALAAAH